MAGLVERARTAIARAIAPKPANPRARAAFAAAQWNRLTSDWVFAASRSADADIRGELRALKNRSREQLRNSPFGARIAQLMAENIVGPKGIQLQAKNQTKEGKLFTAANQAIEDAWDDAGRAQHSDVQRKLGRTEHLALAASNWAVDGEILIRLYRGPQFGPYGFMFQVLDTDFLDEQLNQDQIGQNPLIRNGIEFDAYGAPVAYWLWKRHPFDSVGYGVSPNERVRVPASDIIHHFTPLRPGQTRGVPMGSAVMLTQRIIDGYVEAEVVAARAGSAKMGAIVDADPTNPSTRDPNAGAADIPMEAEPGTFTDLRGTGAKIELFAPDHPSTAVPEFMRAMAHYMAIGYGISYSSLTGDLRDANYSSMKVGQQPERDHWRRLQSSFIEHVVDRLFVEWLKMALLNKATHRKLDIIADHDVNRWTRVKWQPRGFQSPDPLKDIEADLTKVAAGVKTLTQVAAEDGFDLEEILEERKQELELIAAAGVESILPTAKPKGAADAVEEDATTDDPNASTPPGRALRVAR